MYRNIINDNNLENLEGIELEKDNIIMKRQNEYMEYLKANEIAHYIMLWAKYERTDKTTYNEIANGIFEEIFSVSNASRKRIIDISKKLLLTKYGITVEKDVPMILASNIPFNKINDTY